MNKNCLVIVDMQKGFINEHTAHLSRKIADFLEHHQFDSIIATRYCNSKNTACYQLGKWFDCMEGTPSAEIVPEILPYINRIFDKRTFSGFTPELQSFLKQEQFSRLFFCGVNTDCCVLATVFSCYDNVIDCIVIEDLCASTLGILQHRNAIVLLKDNITENRIITTQTFTP